MSLLALAASAPALAQDGSVEVQPLEPLIAPGITQNNDGGGIVVRPVEPLAPGTPGQGAATAPAPGRSEADILDEGFNDDAFGESEESFIDRAFGTGDRPAAEEDRVVLEPADEPPAGETGETPERWFGREGRPDDGLAAAEEDGRDGAGEDRPRFLAAPYTTRGLFGPNRPSPLPRTATVPAEGAELRQLDKMTGATSTVTIEAGEELELGRLRVRLEGCHAPAAGGTHGTVAFLRIWDPQQEGDGPVFSGWMFADSPALSAMDHPRYDLWVLDCTPTEAAGATPAEGGSGEG